MIDALIKSLTANPKSIAHISATKRWVDYEHGWIEIRPIEEPHTVDVLPPSQTKTPA